MKETLSPAELGLMRLRLYGKKMPLRSAAERLGVPLSVLSGLETRALLKLAIAFRTSGR